MNLSPTEIVLRLSGSCIRDKLVASFTTRIYELERERDQLLGRVDLLFQQLEELRQQQFHFGSVRPTQLRRWYAIHDSDLKQISLPQEILISGMDTSSGFSPSLVSIM